MDHKTMEIGAQFERAINSLDRRELDLVGRQTLNSLQNIFSQLELPNKRKDPKAAGIGLNIQDVALSYHQADEIIEEIIRLIRKILDWLRRDVYPSGLMRLMSANSKDFLSTLALSDVPQYDWDIMEKVGLPRTSTEEWFNDALRRVPGLFQDLDAKGASLSSWIVTTGKQIIDELEILRASKDFEAGKAGRQQQNTPASQQSSWWNTAWRGVQIGAGVGLITLNFVKAGATGGITIPAAYASGCVGTGMVAAGARN